MGPVMSARNIALLRSHWTSTILPISVSQTQRSAGLLFGAAHGVFGSCHVRPLSDRQFPELPFESNPCEGGLRLRCAFWPPKDLADRCTIPSPGASLAASPGRHPEA